MAVTELINTREQIFGEQVDICYIITNGFSARIVLDTGLIPELRRRGLRVMVISPGGNEPRFLRAAEEQNFYSQKIDPPCGFLSQLLSKLRPYLFDNIRKNPVLWSSHLRTLYDPKNHPAYYQYLRFLCGVNDIISCSKPMQKAFFSVQARLLRHRKVSALFRRVQPKIVVSTFPINNLEGMVLLEAKRQCIRTAGHIQSWDNINYQPSSWIVIPDRFLAWGPIMAAELRDVFGVSRDHVHYTGAAHFDQHYVDWSREGVETVLRELKLCAKDPFLFFGMSSTIFAPTEIEIVERLAQVVESNRFGPRLQLVVRPHPRNAAWNDTNSSLLLKLNNIRSRRVSIDIPQMHSSSIQLSIADSATYRLVQLVGGCSVCLTSAGSTVSLDAIAHDRPVVVPRFDLGPKRPWWDSVKRCSDFLHQKTLFAIGGVRVEESFSGMVKAIEDYLDDPTRDSHGRQRTREMELGPCDGRATQRIAEVLTNLVRG